MLCGGGGKAASYMHIWLWNSVCLSCEVALTCTGTRVGTGRPGQRATGVPCRQKSSRAVWSDQALNPQNQLYGGRTVIFMAHRHCRLPFVAGISLNCFQADSVSSTHYPVLMLFNICCSTFQCTQYSGLFKCRHQHVACYYKADPQASFCVSLSGNNLAASTRRV